MKLRFRYGVSRWIMGRFSGKVLYPFVLFKAEKAEVTDFLFKHEMHHVHHMREVGVLKWYVKYLWIALTRMTYRNHPYEVRAYDHQHEPLTKEEEEYKEHGER